MQYNAELSDLLLHSLSNLDEILPSVIMYIDSTHTYSVQTTTVVNKIRGTVIVSKT